MQHKRIAPFDTGRVRIGLTWQPRIKPEDARAIERAEPRTQFSSSTVFLAVLSLAMWSAFVLVVTQ